MLLMAGLDLSAATIGPVGNGLGGLEPCRLDLGSWNAELQTDLQKFLRRAFLLSMGSGNLVDSRTTQARDLTRLSVVLTHAGGSIASRVEGQPQA